jgi:hypothetical protein
MSGKDEALSLQPSKFNSFLTLRLSYLVENFANGSVLYLVKSKTYVDIQDTAKPRPTCLSSGLLMLCIFLIIDIYVFTWVIFFLSLSIEFYAFMKDQIKYYFLQRVGFPVHLESHNAL